MDTELSLSARYMMYQIGSFRPSDRREIKAALKAPNGDTVFVEALMDFLEKWDNSDWLEDYNVERVAIWLSVNGSSELLDTIAGRVNGKIISAGGGGSGAYRCFANELQKSREQRTAEGAEPELLNA